MAIAVALSGCDSAPGSASNPKAAGACVPPGDALVARALFDQAGGALAHADAPTAVTELEAGLAKIGYPTAAGPAVLDDTGLGIEAARSTHDPSRLAHVEKNVLAARLADYGRYCGH